MVWAIKESVFYKSLELIKHKPNNFFVIFLFDALFLGILASIGWLIRQYLPGNPDQIQNYVRTSGIYFFLLFFLCYNLFLVFIYSLFKALILQRIGLYDKKKPRLNLKKLFLLNLIIIVCALAVFFFVNILVFFLFKNSFFQALATFFLILYGVALYLFINFAHSLSIKEDSLIKILSKTISAVKRVDRYYGVLVFSCAAVVFSLLFSFGSLKAAGLLKYLFAAISVFFLYAMHFINRLYAYLIIKRI